MSAATAPILRYHQLHSRPSVSTGAPPPRVSVWVHSLLTQHTMLAPVAQAYIDKAAAATGAPWTAVLLDSRCHGASADLGLEPPHNVDSMTDDCMRTLSAGLKQGRWVGLLVMWVVSVSSARQWGNCCYCTPDTGRYQAT